MEEFIAFVPDYLSTEPSEVFVNLGSALIVGILCGAALVKGTSITFAGLDKEIDHMQSTAAAPVAPTGFLFHRF